MTGSVGNRRFSTINTSIVYSIDSAYNLFIDTGMLSWMRELTNAFLCKIETAIVPDFPFSSDTKPEQQT